MLIKKNPDLFGYIRTKRGFSGSFWMINIMLYLEICEELITIIRSDMIEKIVIMCKLILELCKFLKWHQAYYINRKTNFIAFFIQLLIFLTEERYNVFLIEVFDGLHKFTWSAQLYKSCFFFQVYPVIPVCFMKKHLH